MITVMLPGLQCNLPGLFLSMQRKGFDAGVFFGLCACAFLQMLLDLPQVEFTEILSGMRDLHGDLLVDEHGDPRLLQSIGQHPRQYMRCWADRALMILLRRLARPAAWVDLRHFSCREHHGLDPFVNS